MYSPFLSLSINDQISVVRGKILQLPINRFLKDPLVEVVDRAAACFIQGDIQCVVNNLGVISDKISAWQLGTKCTILAFNRW